MKYKNEKELRIAEEIEIRQETEDEMIVEGYALKFENETIIGSKDFGFREVIMRGALDGADIKKVPLKYNHEGGYLALASTKNGSLELTADKVGLRFKAKLINTQANRDVFLMVKEGLLSECSFAFTTPMKDGSEWTFKDGEMPFRKIKKIDRLFDVSLVDIPAYENTEVFVRSFEKLEDAQKTVEAERDKKINLQKRIEIKIKMEVSNDETIQ